MHRIGSRLLFEVPRRELGKDELLVSEIAKTTLGVGYGGQALNNRVIRWERRDNRALSFPDNVNVESTLTFNNPPAPPGTPTTTRGGGFGQQGTSAPSATVVMSYSIHKLPEVPMMARLCDNRVGYFSVTTTDY